MKNNHSSSHYELIERSFLAALNTYPYRRRIQRWLVAHSGGLDSQCLLHLAAEHLPRQAILVVHVNHHLQTEAETWAAFSEAQAKALGVAHVCIDVRPEKQSENAAREARYQAFSVLLGSSDCLLMGHHADDQAETMLFRMLRGAGLVGMAGMPRYRDLARGKLLRPLLHCGRQQLEEAAEERKFEFVIDPSNQTEDYDRNYLRHQVMPLLKKRWPALLQRWQRNADLAAQGSDLLTLYLEQDLKLCSPAIDQLDLKRWWAMNSLKHKELLRLWVFKATAERLNERQVEQITRDVINASEAADPRFHLTKATLRRYRHHLYLVPNDLVSGKGVQRIAEGVAAFSDGELRIGADSHGLKTLKGITMQRRKVGERCRPHGRGGSVSVKKLLQEAGVLPWQRTDWPLLYSGEEVVAVPGICVCEGWYSENAGFSVLWCPFSLSDSA